MEYRWRALLVTTVGVVMVGINSRILVIGLPVVTSALHADAIQAIWFTQAFSLGSTVALLFIGRVGDVVGRVKVYTVGFAAFTASCLLVGLSQSADELIALRLVQGLSASALFANSAAIITDATPSNGLGQAIGINNVAFRAGAIGSLTVSGLVLSLALGDWRVLFVMSIPVGIFGTYLAKRHLHELQAPEGRAGIDWPGFVLFTTSITAFLVGLSIATYGGADYSTAEALIGVSALTMVGFVFAERRRVSPLLDFHLLRIKEFTGGIVASLLNTLAWGGVLLLVSLYMQLVLGYTPLEAGIGILPFDFAFLFVGAISGRLSDRYGHMPFTTSGLLITSLSLYLFSTTSIHTSYLYFAGILVIFGFGTGLFASPNGSSIMGSIPPEMRGAGSGFNGTFANVGFTLSFNLAILILSFSVPYSIITTVISSAGSSLATQADTVAFAGGLNNVYLWLAVINTIAVVPSMLRGKRKDATPKLEPGEGGLGME